MIRKLTVISTIVAIVVSSCSVWQSALKSTFPYKTTVEVPHSSATNTPLSVSGTAKSFDQGFNKNGNDAGKVKNVRIVSAKIDSDDPSDFDLGNFTFYAFALRLQIDEPFQREIDCADVSEDAGSSCGCCFRQKNDFRGATQGGKDCTGTA